MSRIPVKNIYYMMCYAWNVLDESGTLGVSLDDYQQDFNFMGNLLNSALSHQMKLGLYRDYIEETEDLIGIKGKVNFSDSIKRNTLARVKSNCSYDEYSENNIQNQVIKSALYQVLKSDYLCPKLAGSIRNNFNRLSNVELLEFKTLEIDKIKTPRNYRFYNYLIHLSWFIISNSAQSESSGNYQFTDFSQDPRKLRRLYENFIFNFYQTELSNEFKIESKRSYYQGITKDTENGSYIPTLLTDIEIVEKATNQRVIIDTKFEQETLTKNQFGSEKVHSKYLMQLMTYLENRRRETGEISNGMLLYPTIDEHYEFTNKIWDYNVTIMNIDLNQDWKQIKDHLLLIAHKQFKKSEELKLEVA